ncbi:transposon, En/Spm-like protein [Tanacetum coccineum]|uniref:Transposon, En/Spm-like protein n=1 Tax=Tanacetum coccineum TaxID=301880 RepID=A0ABQ4Y7H3_9ASTR
MDKSWIKAHITSKPFKEGVKSFIEFARARSIRGIIACPCLKCCNIEHSNVNKCHGNILRYGFLPGYTNWLVHRENSVPSQPSQPTFVHETSFGEDEIRSLVHDALGQIPSDSRVVGDSMFEDNVGESSQSSHRRVEDENVGIRSLVRDALGQIPSDSRVVGDPMFEDNVGESSQSSHRRVEDENVGESSKSSDDSATYKKLLEECDKELYPGCKYSNLSFTLHLYHVKCIGGVSNKTFGMFLELIRDVFPHLTSLPSSVSEAKKLTKDLGLGYKKIDACLNDCMLYWDTRKDQKYCHVCKASRYKSDTADDIDGLAWKGFDSRYSDFALDPCSVRLGLASDGVNPFRTMSTTHSTWPVLIPYNLPPWLCMKQQSFILSSIIPGEKGPGNDIDVYLQLLIHELKLLWKGVDAYDAFSKQKFKLRASLMWTINDFPAYANLSGWSTKGRVACLICVNSTRSSWLKYGRKFCYMGHRRWLEKNHKYQFQNDQFDGTCKEEGPPTPLTRSDILEQLSGASFIYGKSDDSSNKSNKRTRDGVGCSTNAHDEANAESSVFEDIESFVEEETGQGHLL